MKDETIDELKNVLKEKDTSYDINHLLELEHQYIKQRGIYLKELEHWKSRAFQICQVYSNLQNSCRIVSSDRIYLNISKENQTISIEVVDFEDDVIANYVVSIDDFIANDFEKRLTRKYHKKEEKLKKEKEQEKLEKERKEYERLKQIFEQ